MPTKPKLAAHSLAKHDPKREIFQMLQFSWDVTAALELIKDRKPNAYLNPRDFQKGTGALVYTDDEHYKTVDLNAPIIVAQFKGKKDKEPVKLPIDGWHRIRKASELGFEKLNAYLLTFEESEAIRYR